MNDNTDLDDGMLADLRRVLEVMDPTFPVADELARAALGWRTLDAELAELVHDSATDQPAVTLRGPDDGIRVLSFSTGDVTIDVEYSAGQVVGQVVPAVEARVELHRDGRDDGTVVTADEFGAFLIPDVSPGPVAITCSAPDGSWSVRTSWTAL